MAADLVSWLARLREITEVASLGISVEDALRLVAATARELLPLDFCGVFTPNETKTALLLMGWDGLSRDYVERINETNPVGLGSEAPSSRAYFGGLPVIVTDIEAEHGFEPWGGIAHEQGYRSMISVPLRSGEGVLGTLNGYHAQRHEYTTDEIERMMLLANHAAAALSSAGLVEELRRSNEALVEQRDLLARSQAIREQLLHASLNSRGVDAVLSALQQIVRRRVTYAALHEAGTEGAVDRENVLAARDIIIDGEHVGVLTIWADEGEGHAEARLGSVEELAAGHAVAVLTLELLRQRAASDAEHRIAGELLQDVLSTGVTEQTLSRAAAMGFDLTTLRVATVISVAAPQSAGASAHHIRRAARLTIDRLRLGTPDRLFRPLVAEYRDAIVAVWPDGVGEHVGDSVHAHLVQVYPNAEVTVATSGRPRETLADAVRIARGVHALAASSHAGRSVRAPDLGVAGLLMLVEDTDALRGFVRGTLGAVADYDSARGTELMSTVRELLANGFDRAATARVMRVHPNTIQQRLRRVESLIGRDLGDARTVLDVASAMSVLSVTSLG